ncbi:transcriptional regulator [Mycolicibacterium sp. TY66]|uniref:PucR family transcriptional regulator n=1 Tax=unclassified Mycolicibacterium TaxID=2636767 RepID=UPI001BB349C0|nr:MULTISPECIES: PucR family transcriptional regulator [unclassified Mycolicibacterium]BCI80598.1 transcriptional regulator [Mycolicibacterium sp. TY66]BCJ81740.1 transcriptional regulator [Mycolicibacterium sp. TY81]
MAEPHGTDPSAHIQLIVDLLARSLNRAVLLDDTAMTPMTFSRQLGTVDDVRMHSLLERTTKPEVIAELQALGIDDADPGVAIPPLPQYAMVARYCVPVRSAANHFGYLWVIDPEQSLSAAERALANQAGADLVAVLDRRQTAERAVESARQAVLTRLLAAGAGEPLNAVLLELSAQGMAQPDSLLTVFAFVPSGDAAETEQRLTALRLRLSTVERTHNWFILPGNPVSIFAFCPAHVRVPPQRLAETVTSSIRATFDDAPVIGWSGSRLPLAQAAQSFRDARLACTLAAAGAGPGEAALDWTAAGSWRAVALLADSLADAPDELDALIHPGVAALLAEGRDDLIQTLEAYLSSGGDARRAADTMHLHRSTLYYRLEKITQALGDDVTDLTDGEARFDLMLSIRLARLRRR